MSIDHLLGKVHNVDCLEFMKQLPDKCVDAIITDPPYMFGAASVSGNGNTKISKWADLLNQSYFYKEIITDGKRILKEDSAIWMFFNWRGLPVLMKAVTESNLNIESLLVWDKQWIGPGGNVGLRPSYEVCALIPMGNFRIPNRGLPDIWREKWCSIKPNGHPAEKPDKLLERLVMETPAQIVFDPFMGSGTTAVACERLGRKWFGCELEPKYVAIANKRIEAERAQLKLF